MSRVVVVKISIVFPCIPAIFDTANSMKQRPGEADGRLGSQEIVRPHGIAQ